MLTVYKYGPLFPGHQTLSLPVSARVLCAGTMGQHPPQPFLWARVNPLVRHEKREFLMCQTGYNALPDHAQYISSFVINDWEVFHLFDVTESTVNDANVIVNDLTKASEGGIM